MQKTTQNLQQMGIVIVGHVDHGKSTVIGRLLADTDSLPHGKLEQVKATCERNSKPFEYAFLLDALKDEQAQGITIDAARVFFKTSQRHYIIIDAPGHVEFLKNMITGASRAEAALLVIDAKEGVQENSKRHGFLLSLLGVRQVAVLINKMDLVGYSETHFKKLVEEYTTYLKSIQVKPMAFVPVAAFHGENIIKKSKHMPWYRGESVVQTLDQFKATPVESQRAFRMPVQDIYKFTNKGDDRRIVAGTIQSGKLRVGDEVVFYPSGKRSKVKTIETFNRDPLKEVTAGLAAGFTLTEQIYITRGELAVRADENPPQATTKIRVQLFWLGRNPLVTKKDYFLRIGSSKIPMRVVEINQVIDASDLKKDQHRDHVKRHEIADCTLKLGRAAAFDLSGDVSLTSRFVIVDEYDIAGGGTIQEGLKDDQTWIREKVFMRNFKWESSFIAPELRSLRYSQRPTLVLITGPKDVDRKHVGKRLEEDLFSQGRYVYMLGIGNVLYGLDADIRGVADKKIEHFRRLSEVANILLDAGMILIVTAAEVAQAEMEIIRSSIPQDQIQTVWLGDDMNSSLKCDLRVGTEDPEEASKAIQQWLQDNRVIYRSF